MEIEVKGVSKKYGSRWVFRDMNYHFHSGEKYALTGSNGAGKSTFLNIIVGKIPFTKGSIKYLDSQGSKVAVDDLYKHLSIATTSMNLIEEFKLAELIKFHFKFREEISQGIEKNFLEIIELQKEQKKFIKDFSSGMKQRLKIGLAILTNSDLLVLDEPGANLDEDAKEWYKDLLSKHTQNRTLIIASNDPQDYEICKHQVNIGDFKNGR